MQFVAAAVLVLLAAGVEVAGVDDRKRRGAQAVLAEAFGQQLIVPQADGLEPLAPGREHADRGAVAGLHQAADAGVAERRVVQRAQPMRNRSFMAAAPSTRWPTSRPITAAGSSPTALRTEYRPPTPSGMGKTSLQPKAAASSRSRPDWPGDGDHAAAELLQVAAAGFSQGLEEDAEGDGRFQRAAALADDDDAPVVAPLDQVQQALHGVVVDVVALEVDARPAAAPLARNLVVIRMTAGLEQRPGAHVRAADAQHHHAIHLLGQPIAGGDDPVQQRPL